MPADRSATDPREPSGQEAELVPTLRAAADEVPRVAARIGRRFAREEARRRAHAYLRGLLSPVERKNGWQLAEAVGDHTPYALQHLLGRADWDPDLVRDDLQTYVVEQLGDPAAILRRSCGDPAAILVVDETGVVKKGTASAGVTKQYVGCVGKIENAQVGVFVAYASPQGVAFLDRALYLPQEWTDDPARRRQAGIPDTVGFATKPQLAQAMLERARAAQVPAAWVTADSIYGDDRRLRMWLETQEQPVVLAVSGKEYLNVAATWTQRRVSTLLQELTDLPADAWQRLSAGDGEKGPRLYDWYRLPLVPPLQAGFARWCLVRRSLSDPTDLQAYVVFAPEGTELEQLVRVAGRRWTIEVAFEAAKGEVGLDQYEVRSWTGWHRHMTLALFAQALLTVVRRHLADPASAPPPARGRSQKGQSQQAALHRPSGGNRQGRRGSLATFRQQRRAQQRRAQQRRAQQRRAQQRRAQQRRAQQRRAQQRRAQQGRWPRRPTPRPAAPPSPS
jgi:SRSO17 transposase